HRLTDPRPRRGGEVFDQAYRHFAAVIGVTGPLDKTTRFQAVDHTGDRARGQAEVVGDLSGRRRAQDTQQRAALEVGGVHPAVVRQPVQETEKTYGELPAVVLERHVQIFTCPVPLGTPRRARPAPGTGHGVHGTSYLLAHEWSDHRGVSWPLFPAR